MQCSFAIISDLFPAAFSPTFARARFASFFAATSAAFFQADLICLRVVDLHISKNETRERAALCDLGLYEGTKGNHFSS